MPKSIQANELAPFSTSQNAKSGMIRDCDHCWAPGDAVQVTVDTPLGPIQGPFQYVRRCILCGKEIG
jgi:hypothetical protein